MKPQHAGLPVPRHLSLPVRRAGGAPHTSAQAPTPTKHATGTNTLTHIHMRHAHTHTTSPLAGGLSLAPPLRAHTAQVDAAAWRDSETAAVWTK